MGTSLTLTRSRAGDIMRLVFGCLLCKRGLPHSHESTERINIMELVKQTFWKDCPEKFQVKLRRIVTRKQ